LYIAHDESKGSISGLLRLCLSVLRFPSLDWEENAFNDLIVKSVIETKQIYR
jgi:hypothetical protein